MGLARILKSLLRPGALQPRRPRSGLRRLAWIRCEEPPGSRVLLEYPGGIDNMARVRIIETPEGEVLYLVCEPEPSPDVDTFYSVLMEHLAYASTPPSSWEEPERFVRSLVDAAMREIGIVGALSEEEVAVLRYYVLRDVVGYGIVDVPIRDPHIEDVAMIGPGVPLQIVHREIADPKWIPTNIVILSEEEAARLVRRLAQRCGRYISTAKPLLEASTPEGHRIALHLGEIAGKGPGFVVRKFPEEPYTVTHLIKFGTISPLMAAYFWFEMEHRGSGMIIGAMGAGKTTLLNVVLSTVRPDYHVCTIEDTPELRLPHPGWHAFYTRFAMLVGGGSTIGPFGLTKFSLRCRCDVVSIGEVRGREIHVFMQAIGSGHAGACTFHAGSVEDMVHRMSSPPLDVGPSNIRQLHFVAFMLQRRYCGRSARRVRYVAEIHPWRPEEPTKLDRMIEIVRPEYRDEVWYRVVFEWRPEDDAFVPDTIDELVRKSVRLHYAATLHGLSMHDVAMELEERVRFIEKLVRDNVARWDEIFVRMKRFYAEKRRRG